MISLEAQNLGKSFGRRKVFDGINLSLAEKSSLVITGRNGSGKTTLLKILCGLICPSRGEIAITRDGKTMTPQEGRNHIGLVMPDLELYGELTAWENLNYLGRMRGLVIGKEELREMITGVGLKNREDDLVSSFSSGMKQRLKYAFARLHQPEILLLDEPSANLDEEGMGIMENIIYEQKENGILILATNQKEDFKYGDEIIQLGS
jgi:ABC-type multidrug transport system ATPase subunit